MWVFLHIPKTAGVAVREVLSSKFGKNEIVHVEDPNRFSPENQLARNTNLIHGHFDVSFTERLPGTENKIFTFLRDPLEVTVEGQHSLEAIDQRLRGAGLKLHLSEVKGPVMDRLKNTEFLQHRCRHLTGVSAAAKRRNQLCPGLHLTLQLSALLSELCQIRQRHA